MANGKQKQQSFAVLGQEDGLGGKLREKGIRSQKTGKTDAHPDFFLSKLQAFS